MIASLASLGVVILVLTLFRWIVSVPLLRTLSASIDQWADSVHGFEAEPDA